MNRFIAILINPAIALKNRRHEEGDERKINLRCDGLFLIHKIKDLPVGFPVTVVKVEDHAEVMRMRNGNELRIGLVAFERSIKPGIIGSDGRDGAATGEQQETRHAGMQVVIGGSPAPVILIVRKYSPVELGGAVIMVEIAVYIQPERIDHNSTLQRVFNAK